MKVLDFSKKSPEGVVFERQTFMVMCYTPKVIVFENSIELDKFKRVWELINEIVCESDILLEEIGDSISSCFIDAFEEESYMLDDEDEISRKFILKDISDMDDSNFEDSMMVKLGVLNSKDIWLSMEELSKLIFLLESLLFSEKRSFQLKEDTEKMFLTVLTVWKEDIKLSKRNKFFKVEVEEI